MNRTPAIITQLLVINLIFFIGSQFSYSISRDIFSLFYFENDKFLYSQLVTHMFMHGNFSHLFFNMFGLWIFGKLLEKIWGTKKFLTYYMATGLGAVLLYSIVHQIEISIIESGLTSMEISRVNSVKLIPGGYYGTPLSVIEEKLFLFYNTPVVGASGAIYGLLLAFGYLFPNSVIYLYFAIPVKAKYLVGLYFVYEVYMSLEGANDGTAHLGHVGGAIVGAVFVLFWRKKDRNNFNKTA